MNSTAIKCNCLINPSCQDQAVIYHTSFDYDRNNDISLIYNVSGWIQGCLTIDSLQLSTLECFYVDSDCFPLLLSYVLKMSDLFTALQTPSLRLQPLVYDSAVSRFPPKTSISTVIQELMVEQWKLSLSYEHFYEACAPLYCSYSQSIQKKDVIGVTVVLVSMIGSIVVLLRMVTPHLVKFSLRLSATSRKKPEQGTGLVDVDLIAKRRSVRNNRLKTKIQNLTKLLRTTLIELNIFTLRDLGSDVDRVTAKRYGQWATRLYVVSLITVVVIFACYTMIQPHTSTKSFDKPSFIDYIHLRRTYDDGLKCVCTKIALAYNLFVQITPTFHEVRKNFTAIILLGRCHLFFL